MPEVTGCEPWAAPAGGRRELLCSSWKRSPWECDPGRQEQDRAGQAAQAPPHPLMWAGHTPAPAAGTAPRPAAQGPLRGDNEVWEQSSPAHHQEKEMQWDRARASPQAALVRESWRISTTSHSRARSTWGKTGADPSSCLGMFQQAFIHPPIQERHTPLSQTAANKHFRFPSKLCCFLLD